MLPLTPIEKTTDSLPHVDVTVDAGGLNCPLPILKARQALMKMSAGQVLKVIATDPTSADDFPTFAKATNNELLQVVFDKKCFIFYLKAR